MRKFWSLTWSRPDWDNPREILLRAALQVLIMAVMVLVVGVLNQWFGAEGWREFLGRAWLGWLILSLGSIWFWAAGAWDARCIKKREQAEREKAEADTGEADDSAEKA